MRHTNRLPQTFIVQTISVFADDTAEVTRFEPDQNGVYQIEIDPNAQIEETILAVAGTTPVTRQPAGYHLEVSPSNR